VILTLIEVVMKKKKAFWDKEKEKKMRQKRKIKLNKVKEMDFDEELESFWRK